MANVQFDEDSYTSLSTSADESPSGLIGFILKMGIVKSQKQANIVLFGIFLIVMGIAVSVFFKSGSISKVKPTQTEVIKMKALRLEPPKK